jgi:hypothetical protein
MRKRLSPATGIALLALFVALGGTATAAALITGAQIKNGSIQVIDLSAKARAALKGQRGPRGATGPAGAQGLAGAQGPAGASATALFAVVDENGVLLKGSGVTAVQRTTLGRYLVTFNRTVTDCAAIAGAGTRGTLDTDAITPGLLSTSPSGNQVALIAKKYEFSGHLQPEDVGFHLAVFC